MMYTQQLLILQYAQSRIELRQETQRQFNEALQRLKDAFTQTGKAIVKVFNEVIVQPLIRWFRSPQVQRFLARLRILARRLGLTKPQRKRRANQQIIKVAQRRIANGQSVLGRVR